MIPLYDAMPEEGLEPRHADYDSERRLGLIVIFLVIGEVADEILTEHGGRRSQRGLMKPSLTKKSRPSFGHWAGLFEAFPDDGVGIASELAWRLRPQQG